MHGGQANRLAGGLRIPPPPLALKRYGIDAREQGKIENRFRLRRPGNTNRLIGSALITQMPVRHAAALRQICFLSADLSHGKIFSPPQRHYTLVRTGGPQGYPAAQQFIVDNKFPSEVAVLVNGCIDPSSVGWHSGDSQIHAAGCSHYGKPEECVPKIRFARSRRKLAGVSVLNREPRLRSPEAIFLSQGRRHVNRQGFYAL